MALRIIDDGQEQEIRIRGAVFLFTVAGWGELRAIREQCRDPKTLRVEADAFDEALLRKHVHGWREVVGADGKPAPFSHDLLLRMPGTILLQLTAAICESAKEEEEEQGNSDGSSAS